MRAVKFLTILTISIILLILSGQALAVDPPDIEPDPLEFSDTRVSQTSDAETLTITNTDTKKNLKIRAILLGDQTNFQIVTDPCSNMTIQKSSSCELTISFTPSEDGHFSTSIAVQNNGRNSVDYSTIIGRGVEPKVTLSKSSIDFGDQRINTTSSAKNVTLVNSGDMGLTVTSISTSGDFSETDDCGAGVSAGESCIINVTFTPTEAGAHSGDATIVDDAEGSPRTVSLTGTGINVGEPGISLSTTSINFGNVTVDTTSDAEEITVTSTGTANLTITAITASGAFDQTNDCAASLASDATCTISATFTPTSETSFSGTILIDNNTDDSPEEVSLSGAGTSTVPDTPSVSISAAIIEFGEQVVKTQSDPQSVTVTNSGTADLIISTVTIGGEGGSSFSKNDDCHGKTVTAGNTCTIDAAFTPIMAGEFTGIISMADNASDTPQAVTLDGTGIINPTAGGCSLVR